MFDYRAFALRKLVSITPRYLPFADVATEDVPLSRLLRLSLFQVTVGMAVVLLVGTLNRVMIVELEVPATLVAVMLALPLIFAPLRTFIGYKSDVHVSALGWKRIPYIWKGTLYQFGGFAIMPFALLVLSGYGEAVDAPRWIGLSSAALAFLLVGAGVHMVQTVGLALATDLVAGHYRIIFHVADYFAAMKKPTFFPVVRIEFLVDDPMEHYHVPLLLSPFGGVLFVRVIRSVGL